MNLKKKDKKISIIVNFLNRDLVYNTQSIIHEEIMRVRITPKKTTQK